MSITFNAFEIFEMAEQIERNGVKFYRKAAQSISDRDVRQTLLDLADMEAEHEETFAGMRKQLSDEDRELRVFDPENEVALYLQAMADTHGYEGKITPTKALIGNETPKKIIEIALNAEYESVVFYFGLKSFVSEKAGKDKVEAIIMEELSHITTLLKKLKSL